MYLQGLSLQNFRNYSSKTLLFSQPITIVVAPNASGKTNLLEALHLLSTGESFRAGAVDDFIQVDQEYGRIKGKISKDGEESEIELLLTRGVVAGKRSAKKIFSVNGVRRVKQKVVGHLSVVSFIPEDLRLITGSPARRRSFLNDLLSQLDPEYTHALTTYEQTLKRRNKLLQLIRDNKIPATTLSYWNTSLLKHGVYLQEQRRQLFDRFTAIPFPMELSIQYDPSVISEARMAQYAEAELAVGHTLVGPHKDDYMVHFELNSQPPTTNHQPLSTHGSRGQQRMGVLWLKIAAFTFLKEKNGTPPLLLLDDIFSELDIKNRQLVLDLIAQTQTILSSAEEEVLELEELKQADIIRLWKPSSSSHMRGSILYYFLDSCLRRND